MKSFLRPTILFILVFSNLFAQLMKEHELLTQNNLKAGETFTVFYETLSYYKLKKVKPGSITDGAVDTLKVGSKFTLLGVKETSEKDFVTAKMVKRPVLVVQKENGDVREITSLYSIGKNYVKEGEDAGPQKIYTFLRHLFDWQGKMFWLSFLISAVLAFTYIKSFRYIDSKLHSAVKKEQKIFFPGKSFFFASGIVGAVTGLLVFFTGDQFCEFYMFAPTFTFPSEKSWIFQYYWALQFLLIPFLAFAVYRNIQEFGNKFGLIRSAILLAASIAFFWTGVTIALIGIGLIIVMLSAKVVEATTPKVERLVNVAEYDTIGGLKTQVRTYVSDDGTKRKDYINSN